MRTKSAGSGVGVRSGAESTEVRELGDEVYVVYEWWYGARVGVVGLLGREDLGGGRMMISCGWRYVSKG